MFSDSSEEENLDRFKEATDINFFKNSLYKEGDENDEEENKVEPLPSLRIKDEYNQFKLFNVTPQFQKYVANALSEKIEKYLKENSAEYCKKKKKKRKTIDYIKLLSSSIYPIEIENEKEKVFNTKPKSDEKCTTIKKIDLKSVTITGEEILSKKETEYWSNRSKAPVYNYKESVKASSLQKKWKSLRDNFTREMRKMETAKSGSGASKRLSYIHFNRLCFLQASTANKDTESSFDSDNASGSSEITDVEANSSFKSPVFTPRRRQKISAADERFASILEESLARKNDMEQKDNDDEDKLFCLSLVREIKRIPENRRLHTTIGIYNLILQNPNFPNQNPRNLFPQRSKYFSHEQHNHTSVGDRYQHQIITAK